MKPFYLVALFLNIILLSTAAEARIGRGRSGDMFYDQNWVYDRPAVPSDKYRGQDMIRPVPLMYNRDADVFARANRRNNIGNEDMFPRRGYTYPPHKVLVLDP